MIEQFHNKAYRGVIFPKKYKVINGKKIGEYKEPLATGLMGGFSGFIDIKFRHHDFYLGRNNARNYIRAFLSFPYETNSKGEVTKIHPIHKKWTPEQREKFQVPFNKVNHLPIIPDMNKLLNLSNEPEYYSYTIPEFRQITEDDLLRLKEPLKQRVKEILSVADKKLADSQQKKTRKRKTVKKWLIAKFKKRIFNTITELAADKAIDFLYNELGKSGLIEHYETDSTVEIPPHDTVSLALVDAIKYNKSARIEYTDLKGKKSVREISNVRITREQDDFGVRFEHIKAFCHTRNEDRTFKVERINKVELIDK
jgi:hypothetical protein